VKVGEMNENQETGVRIEFTGGRGSIVRKEGIVVLDIVIKKISEVGAQSVGTIHRSAVPGKRLPNKFPIFEMLFIYLPGHCS
jgi:hypothetical protein